MEKSLEGQTDKKNEELNSNLILILRFLLLQNNKENNNNKFSKIISQFIKENNIEKNTINKISEEEEYRDIEQILSTLSDTQNFWNQDKEKIKKILEDKWKFEIKDYEIFKDDGVIGVVTTMKKGEKIGYLFDKNLSLIEEIDGYEIINVNKFHIYLDKDCQDCKEKLAGEVGVFDKNTNSKKLLFFKEDKIIEKYDGEKIEQYYYKGYREEFSKDGKIYSAKPFGLIDIEGGKTLPFFGKKIIRKIGKKEKEIVDCNYVIESNNYGIEIHIKYKDDSGQIKEDIFESVNFDDKTGKIVSGRW